MRAAATHTHITGAGDASATAPVSTMAGERSGEPVAQTVARVKSGDGDAVRVLYAAYRDSVFGYVLSMLRDPAAAQDVAERVFLELTSVIHTYDPRQVPFASWLLRAARNAALDHLRRPRSARCADVCVLVRAGEPARVPGQSPPLASVHNLRPGSRTSLKRKATGGEAAPAARAAAS